MSKKDDLRIPDYLGHIIEAIERIQRYVEDMSEVDFLDDEKTQDAVVRNFEIIGEVSRNIERHHPAYARSHPEIPWIFMYTMRNCIAHGYFKVDFELVWQAIHADLLELHEQVRQLVVPAGLI